MQLDNIPRVRVGFLPTPLEEMPRLRDALGEDCPRLLVKRDDYTGFAFGGNKVRKIEYAIAREIANDTKTMITVGGEKSNHARITAAVCARFGLRCILVLNRSANAEGSSYIPASRFAYEMFGAETLWVAGRQDREPTAMAFARELTEAGEQAAYFPLGLSMPIGAIGYVQAYKEVMTQFDQLELRPDYIFHSSSSGGTQAGLVAGNRLFGNGTTKIIGVSPDDSANEIAGHVAEIANGIFKMLEEPNITVSAADITVLDDFIGKGYGIETAESKEAEQLLARTEGIILDPLYTSKSAAAMIDWIRKGRFIPDQSILFWHTGGQLAHFYAPVFTKEDTDDGK